MLQFATVGRILALETGLLTRTDHCQTKNEATGAPGELEQMLGELNRRKAAARRCIAQYHRNG